jgi:hypothetical protein
MSERHTNHILINYRGRRYDRGAKLWQISPSGMSAALGWIRKLARGKNRGPFIREYEWWGGEVIADG